MYTFELAETAATWRTRQYKKAATFPPLIHLLELSLLSDHQSILLSEGPTQIT